eukprot:gene4083-4422_t
MHPFGVVVTYDAAVLPVAEGFVGGIQADVADQRYPAVSSVVVESRQREPPAMHKVSPAAPAQRR